MSTGGVAAPACRQLTGVEPLTRGVQGSAVKRRGGVEEKERWWSVEHGIDRLCH
jgi:hypothetical protein